jgi:hypothetical protein
MLFLIEYDRRRGQIITFERYPDSRRREAEEARLRMELRLTGAGIEREVVLMEAASEAALRQTHRRYFESLAVLAAG